jgi:O-antigen/teichoic acid export membrane protein
MGQGVVSSSSTSLPSEPQPPPEESTLEPAPRSVPPSFSAKARKSSFWALGGYGASQALRLASNLVLWRLLFPEAFGIMAIVNVFMQGLQMFSDVGIGPSIVQSKRGTDPEYLNTAWTIQVIRGFVLFVCAVLVAAPVATFYEEPQLAQLIPAVAVGCILSGFNSTRLFTTTRNLALARLTLLDLIVQVFGLMVMIGSAYVFRSVWALVAGGLASGCLKVFLSHTMLTGNRDRLRWDRPSAEELIRFGRWIFLSTMLAFATLNADRLIFGKLIPMSMLGVYSIGMMWASFPMTAIGQVFNSVIFPLLSRYNDTPSDFASVYRKTRLPWLVVGGWACVCLLAGGPTLIRCLYDERASDAGWIIQVLSVSTWLLCLETGASTALLAKGKSQWVAAGSAGKLLGMVVCIPLGFRIAGFPGALYGYAASEFLRYAVCILGALKTKVRALMQDLWLTLMVVATAGLGLVTAASARAALAGLSVSHHRLGAVLEGLAIVLVVSAAWGVMFLWARSQKALVPAPKT